MAPSVVYIDEVEKVFVSDKKNAREFGGQVGSSVLTQFECLVLMSGHCACAQAKQVPDHCVCGLVSVHCVCA
jgi:hypothetical protein